MTYLKQFARNRRSKENTTVLTARLPESLYNDFKTYCDELGLSISEAVSLLVEREVAGTQAESEVAVSLHTETDIKNDDVVKVNTKVVKKNTDKKQSDSKRFTMTEFKIQNELPCPICDKWLNHSNISRHAKDEHNTDSKGIFANPMYSEKIQAMIEKRKNQLEITP